MFVKVRTNEPGWWIFQTDLRVHYAKAEWKSKEDYEKESDAAYVIFDDNDNATLPGNWDYKKKPFKYVRLILNLANGEVRAIFFNTVAYICNDAGKTIEVIRADS